MSRIRVGSDKRRAAALASLELLGNFREVSELFTVGPLKGLTGMQYMTAKRLNKQRFSVATLRRLDYCFDLVPFAWKGARALHTSSLIFSAPKLFDWGTFYARNKKGF